MKVEYIIEGLLLGLFMIAACLGTAAVEHPASPVRRRLRNAAARRAVVGVLMGLTAVALIYSPPGQRSGAHMNPATTLAFLALGKVRAVDGAAYIAAQFIGGLLGVVAAARLLPRLVAHESVSYAVTEPGPRGRAWAFAGEFVISLLMMLMVLAASNHASTAPYTGVLAGVLLAVYITVEAPLSGMSLNPARTVASAIPARRARALWVYFAAPILGMLTAAGVFVAAGPAARRAGLHPGEVYCAKLKHPDGGECIFRCRAGEMTRTGSPGR